jgi:hypothetical protein
MPVACIWAYIIVEPTNLNPRFLRSLLTASEMSVVAGTCPGSVHAFLMGFPSTNCQMYRSNDPNSSCTLRNAFALVTAAATFKRLRMIPSFASSFAILASVYRETFFGSKP